MTKINDPIGQYQAALQRLRDGNPKVVATGTRITNDAVSLEAGKGKGSIKKSRAMFSDLVRDIESAAKVQAKDREKGPSAHVQFKKSEGQYKLLWEAGLCRELSLLKELSELKQRLNQLTGANVLPIRSSVSSSDPGIGQDRS